MAKKWVVRVIAIFMALIMALSVLYVVIGSITASAVTQGQIDKLKKDQKEIEKKKQEIQSKINSMEYEQKSAIAKKEVLDDQIQLTQEDIANATDQIETYRQLIEVKAGEVIEAQKTEDEQWVRYKANLRTMEENGTISYISVVFAANSFADLLARVEIVGSIMENDVKIYDELKAAKQATIDAKTSLEEAKKNQEAEKANLIVKEEELQKQRAAADALVKEIEANIETE
jgi:peptidoglycan hydrolase CwlO-like protein